MWKEASDDVTDDGCDVDRLAELAGAVCDCAPGADGVEASAVGDDFDAAFDDGRQELIGVGDEVAHPSPCLVALSFLLQDGECELGEAVEDQVVAGIGKGSHRFGGIAVEALCAADGDGVGSSRAE